MKIQKKNVFFGGGRWGGVRGGFRVDVNEIEVGGGGGGGVRVDVNEELKFL